MYQLRTYTFTDEEAARKYLEINWRKHLKTLPKFGVRVHSVYRLDCQVFALISYDESLTREDIMGVTKRYLQSEEFRSDMEGCDYSRLKHVEEAYVEALDIDEKPAAGPVPDPAPGEEKEQDPEQSAAGSTDPRGLALQDGDGKGCTES